MTVEKWKHDGVRVIPGNSLDGNTPQTPGMDRKAAIDFARVGADFHNLGCGEDSITIPARNPLGAR